MWMAPWTMTASRWAGRTDGSGPSNCASVAARSILSASLSGIGNGTQEEIPIRARIPNGGQTRAIDLPGERRMIESVDLWYSKDHWSRRPKVSLYGIR